MFLYNFFIHYYVSIDKFVEGQSVLYKRFELLSSYSGHKTALISQRTTTRMTIIHICITNHIEQKEFKLTI